MTAFDAEIIAVGSELLTPSKVDTNSLWLTDQLNALGVEVVRKSIVGDDRGHLRDAITNALGHAHILLLTGGLGPTEDDVTRDAVAAVLGRTQTFREDVCEAIQERFRRMKRQMAEINKRQAFILEGAEVLANPAGTAPGQWLEDNDRVIALLPGPPREMKGVWTAEVLPRLKRKLPPQVIRTRFYRVACMPESDLDQLIAPVYTKYTNPVTTILAALGDIQIHLRARCESEAEAEALLAEVGGQIEPLVGDRIYTTVGLPLEQCIGEMLLARGASVAVAESATGGLLGERISSVAGASRYFDGGVVAYTQTAKSELLGVPAELIEKHNAVSEPVAKAMAEGARKRLGSTFAVSITGFAGPDGGTEADPVGTVYIGLAGPDGASAKRLYFSGDRARIRTMAVQWALDLLRRRIA